MKNKRLRRGIDLGIHEGHRITRLPGGTYRVPGSCREWYRVDVERKFCTCRDQQKCILQGKAPEGVDRCKHQWMVIVAEAKGLVSDRILEQA